MSEIRPCVFIHTNERQMLGALVGAHALKRNSPNAGKFDVRILKTEDYPFIAAMHGRPFRRAGVERVWDKEDLQSFTPLRFLPPELMGYQGRAVVITCPLEQAELYRDRLQSFGLGVSIERA